FASVPLPYNAKKLQSNLAKLLAWILSLHLDGLVVTNNEDAHAASRQNNAYHFTFTVYVPSTPPFSKKFTHSRWYSSLTILYHGQTLSSHLTTQHAQSGRPTVLLTSKIGRASCRG